MANHSGIDRLPFLPQGQPGEIALKVLVERASIPGGLKMADEDMEAMIYFMINGGSFIRHDISMRPCIKELLDAQSANCKSGKMQSAGVGIHKTMSGGGDSIPDSTPRRVGTCDLTATHVETCSSGPQNEHGGREAADESSPDLFNSHFIEMDRSWYRLEVVEAADASELGLLSHIHPRATGSSSGDGRGAKAEGFNEECPNKENTHRVHMNREKMARAKANNRVALSKKSRVGSHLHGTK